MTRLLSILLLLITAIPSGAYAEILKQVVPNLGAVEVNTAKDEIFVGIRHDLVSSKMYSALEEQIADAEVGDDVSVSLIGFSFLEAGSDPSLLQVSFRIKAQKKGVISETIRCDVSAGFRIRISQNLAVSAGMDGKPRVDCNTSSVIGGLLKLNALAEEFIEDHLSKALTGSSFTDVLKVPDWITEGMPPEVLNKVGAWFGHCDRRDIAYICLRLSLPAGSLNFIMATVEKLAPSPIGLGAAIEQERIRSWLNHAPTKASGRVPGLTYPTKQRENGEFDHDDMVLFGGLLCLTSLLTKANKDIASAGCNLVAHSQGPKVGQWWRSPDSFGKKQKQFSGDQLNGVIAYLLATKDKVRLEKYLDFITDNFERLSPAGFPVSELYFYCSIDNGTQCLALGQDWYWLNRVAAELLLSSKIPAAARRSYGFDTRWLPFFATVNPAGYRVHLIAVSVFMLQLSGASDENIRRTAAILAAREPGNPFFRYLHLGRDRSVTDLVNQKCPQIGAAPPKNKYEWSWERTDKDEAWKNTMYWDCLFMAQLLER